MFCFPTLGFILLTITWNSLWSYLKNLEFSKRILARIYRKKIESIVGEKSSATSAVLPSEYSIVFDGNGLNEDCLVIDANERAFNKVKREISSWMAYVEEDQSVAIHGEKGVGKTTLLNRIEAEFSELLDVIRITVPQKVWNREGLTGFLSKELGFETSDNVKKGILTLNKSLLKNTLVLIDDAHNLFLGKYGGFEAFREFVNLVNLKTDKIFWCSTFNKYSWAFIKGVMGSSQYLRTEIALEGWSDRALKDLILKRHKLSNYTLSYDQMILASRSTVGHSEAIVEAEDQFFRLLWEQSKGNPRVAQYLWVNSLSMHGKNTLRVFLPESPKINLFNTLDDNSWFVFAAIAKHENLTRSEVAATTNLDWALVAHSIKFGLENKLLYKGDDNRYRLHLAYQHDVIKQLRMKNFIYGTE